VKPKIINRKILDMKKIIKIYETNLNVLELAKELKVNLKLSKL
jgi:hypothetical protein